MSAATRYQERRTRLEAIYPEADAWTIAMRADDLLDGDEQGLCDLIAYNPAGVTFDELLETARLPHAELDRRLLRVARRPWLTCVGAGIVQRFVAVPLPVALAEMAREHGMERPAKIGGGR